MANTFLLANGHMKLEILFMKKKMLKFSKEIIDQYSDKLGVPIDAIVTDKKLQKNPRARS